ncbi:MAG: AAA family ATPase [Thermomicrobiales bacterium]
MTPIRHSESDEPSPDLNNIIEALSDPSAFPGNVDEVIAIETHASAVFIAGDSVYKLKKPVNFGFLNYESASRRRLMCHLEVQVNQELAPDVYRGVVDLVTDDGEIRIGRAGRVIDHLVHMHRLPERATLASLMEQESAQIEDIDRIAMRIAGFHRRAYRSPEIDRWGLPAAVRRNVEENFEQVAPYLNRAIPPAAFDGIANYARNFLLERRGLLNARVRDGFTRDGHGDIRAEHVYVQDEVRIIDRIEFNDRIRYGDVAADVGFLAMDLDASNRPDLSDRLIETYQDRSDLDVDSVLDFYRCYRAYVRGKVTAFRLDQSPEERQQAISIEARRFFHLASRYASNDRRPRLIVMTGLTGSGKSTLARHLAAVLPAAVLDSDRTRKRLAGMDATSRQTVPFGSGIYSEELTERVYGEHEMVLASSLNGARRSSSMRPTHARVIAGPRLIWPLPLTPGS